MRENAFPPSRGTSRILIVPIGGIEEFLVWGIADFVGQYYSSLGLSVKIGDVIPEEVFSRAYNPLRRQYAGRFFLPVLAEVRKRKNAAAALGVTRLDLYEEGLNFIFGLGHAGLRAAIISTFRLRPEFCGESSDGELLLTRAIKEAMHELGHVFGLGHCPDERCVMHFSNSVIDTDIKSPFYCRSCRRKLEKNLGVSS